MSTDTNAQLSNPYEANVNEQATGQQFAEQTVKAPKGDSMSSYQTTTQCPTTRTPLYPSYMKTQN